MSEELEDNTLPNNLFMFQAAISKSFKDISKCVSENSFLEILTILKSKPTIAKKLHKAMEKDLCNFLQMDLKDLMSEECLIQGMKKVNHLIEETTVPVNSNVWRPPGDVNLHLRSLDAEKIKKECENLELNIRIIEKENEDLMKKVIKRRDSIQSIHREMKQSLNMPFLLSDLESTYKFNQECITKLNDSL